MKKYCVSIEFHTGQEYFIAKMYRKNFLFLKKTIARNTKYYPGEYELTAFNNCKEFPDDKTAKLWFMMEYGG